jgi:transketolase
MEMETSTDVLKEKARRLRALSLRSTTAAGSGHPSTCLSAADLVSALFYRIMRYDPADEANRANDRFVLSKGHAAPLLWAAYAEAGIVSEAEVLTLRKFSGRLEGHPTPRMRWVDVATGSLGQGLSAGLGMALASKLDRIDYDTYVLLGDGECAEGSVWEAAALASHYHADNLYAIVDVNGLGQSQATMHGFDTEWYARVFQAFGWHAVTVDGHDMDAILDAFRQCREEGGDRPRAILARTYKGRGVSFLEDRSLLRDVPNWHGKPVPQDRLEAALAELGAPGAPNGFTPHPRPAPEAVSGPSGHRVKVSRKKGESAATREAYGDALASLAEGDPRIVALDGDTKNSTFAEKIFETRPSHFFEMFIAEQNMVGVAAGFSSCGKIPFVSTFAAFLTRAFDQIRMARISEADIRFVGSHCGVSIGPDGPSQMGLEDIAMFRAIPDSVILYPSDAVSTEHLVARLADQKGISYLRTSRPKTPVLYDADEEFDIGGSKVLRRSDTDRLTIVAAGITVHEAIGAASALEAEGILVRIIDAYSVKPLDEATILEAVRETGQLLVVEDHYFEGGLGDAVLNVVGNRGAVEKVAIQGLPRSGTPEELIDAFGIGAAGIAARVRDLVG